MFLPHTLLSAAAAELCAGNDGAHIPACVNAASARVRASHSQRCESLPFFVWGQKQTKKRYEALVSGVPRLAKEARLLSLSLATKLSLLTDVQNDVGDEKEAGAPP